jgi:hypothetical protein
MHEHSLSPLSVVDFHKDYLIEFVRHKTGWDQRNEVSAKTQLNYLCNYLADAQIGCQTIIVEDEYIDRHYLEDYSEYYARCFPSHPRKCSRVHFFSEKFDQQQFVIGLSTNDKVLADQLRESYLGFAVIRPIPHTFFAKICLAQYKDLRTREYSKILTRDVHVSLFGLDLVVQTIPFLEQDKVVSACATSAVWTALSASTEFPMSRLPSPSAITKAASNSNYDGTRTFPTIGLSPHQVARSLKIFGNEPSIFPCDTEGDRSDLQEHIYSYIQSGTPVIMGGEVYELAGEKVRHLGKHLVCVVGYSTRSCEHQPGLRLLSHEIDKIYVHDDRYGPFVKVRMAPRTFVHDEETKTGLALSFNGCDNDVFVPEIAIVGLDHKVRIPYSQVFNICTSFVAHCDLALQDINEEVSRKTLSDDEKSEYAALSKLFKVFTDGVWDIALTTSVKVKQEVLPSTSFTTFNGMLNKSSLLLQSMPKHVWRCRVHEKTDGKNLPFTDILFDATEVPQGRVLVGFIAYSTNAQTIWNYVSELIEFRVWQQYRLSDNSIKQFIGCFVRFFSELKDRTYLNTLYGPAGVPRRALKPGESDESSSIAKRPDTLTVRRGGAFDWGTLRKDKKYIWVINEPGDIVLGEDIATSSADGKTSFQGHPTLIDGKPGRVAGELIYVPETNTWKINLQSRAYTGHLDRRSEEARGYLRNVIAVNLVGLPVQLSEDVHSQSGKAERATDKAAILTTDSVSN